MNEKRGHYIIWYSGILCTGYVKFVLFGNSKHKPLTTHIDGLNFASKFRSKRIANLFCRFMNWYSEFVTEFKTYHIIFVAHEKNPNYRRGVYDVNYDPPFQLRNNADGNGITKAD